MYLKSLIIECENRLIREINFHMGMNLIIDKTKEANASATKSGNSVGKTTVLRLINYCLGGSAESIYKDPEFKNKSNEEIESFLTEENILVTLNLLKDLNDPKSKGITIRRNFLQRNKKILEVNGQAVKSKELDSVLKESFFAYSEDKPTFKQLKAKNIRDEAERLENTVKVLGPYGKNEEYEALYLFWLGVPYPDAEKKRRLLEEQKIENKIFNRLQKDNSQSKLQQFLNIVKRDIEELEKRKNNFNLNEEYEADLEVLNKTRTKLNQLSSQQSQLELRLELIEESREELENDQANPETSQIAELYSQAKVLIPNLQKSYEETVTFHNEMIAEKVTYITGEIPELKQKLSQVKSSIQKELAKEKESAKKLQKDGAIDELQDVLTQLNELYEQKGKFEEKVEQLENSKESLNLIGRNLAEIDKSINNLDELVQSRVSEFNKYFSEISNNLYGEKFALSAPFEKSPKSENSFYKLYVDSLSSRPGTGKKKGEITAFDIAYVRFADSKGIPCLHFILHDQMETVDHNQIQGLFKEVIKANCQLIVPILRDKLPENLTNPEYQVLSLSQDDKLFRV